MCKVRGISIAGTRMSYICCFTCYRTMVRRGCQIPTWKLDDPRAQTAALNSIMKISLVSDALSPPLFQDEQQSLRTERKVKASGLGPNPWHFYMFVFHNWNGSTTANPRQPGDTLEALSSPRYCPPLSQEYWAHLQVIPRQAVLPVYIP